MSDDAGCVDALERATGHSFTRRELAETALAHPSYAHEVDGSRGNERLEFLGDAVLDLVVARVLYERRPDWREGELSRLRASLVNQKALAARARALGLPALVKLGKTEEPAGREKSSILANCFEAVVGAVYLDGGLAPAEALIERSFGEALSPDRAPRDVKSALNEWAHAEYREAPWYRTVADSDVDGDEERFTVEVLVGDELLGRGSGRTKRAAEVEAARAALGRAGERT